MSAETVREASRCEAVGRNADRPAREVIAELHALSPVAKGELRHLLNQPLSIIKGNAQLLGMNHPGDADVENKSAQISMAVDRISREIREALGLEL